MTRVESSRNSHVRMGMHRAADASSDPAVQAFRFFEGLARGDADDILRALTIRRRLVLDERARAIAVCPRGRVYRQIATNAQSWRNLKDRLTYHGRTEAFAIRLIDVPQAAVALHQRAVLIISRPALRIFQQPSCRRSWRTKLVTIIFWGTSRRCSRAVIRTGCRNLNSSAMASPC